MSVPVRLWSVTTLIKLGLGTSDPLVNWAVKTTAEYAVDQQAAWTPLATADRDAAVKVLTESRWAATKKAAARGTDVHKAAEQLALGVTPAIADDMLPYVDQYRTFLRDFEPTFLMSEAPVYSPTYGYAGTCDGIMEIDGQTVIFDLKTTAHAPDSDKSRPPFGEVALQLCAYSRAEQVGVLSEMRYDGRGKRYYAYDPDGKHEPMPKVDGALCIVISPYDLMAVPVRIDDEVWRHFRHVMECARWQVEVSRNVFGPPITAKATEVAV